MNAPERLLAGEATEFERELLGTWGRRQPSAEARAKVLAVAGAGLGMAVLGSASATAAKAASTSIAPKAVVGWSAALVKWLAVGIVGATATAGAVAYVSRHSELSVTSPEVPAVTAATARASATPLSTAAATAAEPLATIELGPDMAPAVKAKSPASARSSTLDEEVASIDQARLAVTRGDAPTALQIVGAYDAKFPNGALAQESAEIRIEALFAEGHRAAAERLAAKFTAAHPTSPYVHRLHALLGEPSSDTKKP
jgi:hypothetical protein